ncbi:MAG: hypothetical protein BGN87_13765 [Rhizobiales bacterium 65-79]|nr:hypothetical protein [Hyphomicrobiales bacterium]OJU05079.1 MAG: hypothetical protein BGN87_13765 [Rhizobiales bacterium 65-79]
MPKTVLVIGSAPEAVEARNYDARGIDHIVAINNAWQVRPDWTHLVHPEDFPPERRPAPAAGQNIVTYRDYVPSNNRFGGVIYAGGTMAFSTAYWVLDALAPDIMGFCGCDMVYDRDGGQSHFYGNGEADPLRRDPTLQSLEAKANRLAVLAAEEGCLCVNLSGLPRSRLTFPKMMPAMLAGDLAEFHRSGLTDLRDRVVPSAREKASALEREKNIVVPGGDYWNAPGKLDAEALASIDALWLEALSAPPATQGGKDPSPKVCDEPE